MNFSIYLSFQFPKHPRSATLGRTPAIQGSREKLFVRFYQRPFDLEMGVHVSSKHVILEWRENAGKHKHTHTHNELILCVGKCIHSTSVYIMSIGP